jgi:ABC-type Mn2+/Zn2+ transport system permease subunit/Mn-dependent DtxR family transcriptional regulator
VSISLAQLQIEWSQWLLPWDTLYLKGTLCSLLVGLGCGVLGCFVVLRQMALIGDALSHAVLPGVVLAYMFTGDTQPIPLLIGALGSGLVAAVLINLTTRFSRTKEDSSIGIVFTALFALGIVLVSNLPRGTHFDLKCFLWGEPLAVTEADLTMMAVIAAAVMLIVALLYHRLKLVSFDPLVAAAMGIGVGAMHYLLMGMLSATVVAGLKTTGVILVVAMVITPASAAYQLTNRFSVMLVLAGVFGMVSAVLGMSVAFIFNASTGPSMVLVATAIFGLSVLLSPSHGLIFDRLRRHRLAQHVRGEDVLKAVYRHGPFAPDTHLPPLIEALRLPVKRIRGALDRLRREGLVTPEPQGVAVTETGRKHAEQLVRSHRLWETYLAERVGVDPQDVHLEAERLEHAHDLADRLDETLGRPEKDPHGAAIPRE